MEFWDWATTTLNIFGYSWTGWLTAALCYLVVYVFRSVALFTIAKREGFKNKWMAFVPFLSTYYVGVCAQANKIYGAKTQVISLIAAIFEAMVFAYYVVYYAVAITIEQNGFYVVESGLNVLGNTVNTYSADYTKLANYGWQWMGWIYDNGSYLGNVLGLLWFIFSLLLYIAFFQTYGSRFYWIFAVTSAFFPISGILFFVVRNNKAKNYRAYIRAQQEQIYRMHQQYYNQYQQNPYNQNPYNQNPYNQNPYDRSNSHAPDPFDGYGNNNSQQSGQSNNSNSSNSSNSSSNGSDSDDPFEGFDK
jgi:type II secretory pathway pseudopilin PulG